MARRRAAAGTPSAATAHGEDAPPAVEAFLEIAVPVPIEGLLTYRYAGPSPVPTLGCRVIVPLGKRSVTGVVVGQCDAAPAGFALKNVTRVLDLEPLFDDEWFELARWVSRTTLTTIGETVGAMIPSARRTRELAELAGDEPAIAPERLTLSKEQERAIAAIWSAGQAPADSGAERSQPWFYLYGITGSGKTEVFLRLAEQTIESGRSVIYLVPEIALTHQLFDHISRRFGPIAAMLHSGLTPTQRLGEWQRVRRGEARLVVGARSAVFAPVWRLGLVVIDEEHEGSYKSGQAPRYHARQVAMWRASRVGAPCVMGSATPSVEAWHLMQQGRLHRLDLTRRLAGGALPSVQILDIKGSSSLISEPLREALLETHRLGAQSILFLNRRGFARVFSCRSCGYQSECPHCSVPMTWHRRIGRMVCHYCGHRESPQSSCPSCGSLDVGYTGFGTERIEDDLSRALPEVRIARLDTDVTARKGALREILDTFARHEADVLVGTQMVAKGLNFPGVRTVGIVLADTGLSMPDFRAAERTFSLIVQVAGRAGRFREDGEVLVQTLRPHHDAIRLAARGELETFYRQELAVRSEVGFPPYARLLRIVVRAAVRERAEADLNALVAAVEADIGSASAGTGTPSLLASGPAALERLNGSWRYHLLLRGAAATPLVGVARRALATVRVTEGCYREIDVDPVNLL